MHRTTPASLLPGVIADEAASLGPRRENELPEDAFKGTFATARKRNFTDVTGWSA